MKQFEEKNRRFRNSSISNSIESGRPKLTHLSYQQLLDEIGGEPLVGSGFESEEPEDGSYQAGEEN